MNVLGIGLDYLMLQDNKVRGDVRKRQFDYAARLGSLTMIVYSPANLRLRAQRWAENLYVYPTNSLNKATFVMDALRLASILSKEKQIDVITTEDPFTTGFIGYLLKRKLKVPLNMQVHNDFCDNRYWIKTRMINWFFNKLGKFNLRRADTIRVGTYYERKKLSEKLGISPEKIFVIPVNSDVEKFNADGSLVRSERLNGRFEKMLLFTGRLVAQKGLGTLLRALGIIIQRKPSTLLVIVGSGPEESALKKLARDLKITDNVVFTGSVEHQKIPEYVAACDVYTISSLFEGTCIAMAEAMAAGKPVVATRFAGAHDLISDGNTGYTVDQEDYRSFARRVIDLLENPKKAEEIGKKASVFIREKFANNKNIDGMTQLWENTSKKQK